MDINLYNSGQSESLSPSAVANKFNNGHNGHVVEEDEDLFQFENAQLPVDILKGLKNLQKQNQFCDAVLRVGEREVQVHRAVLAASSPFLFELFQRSSNTHHNDSPLHPTASMYKLRDVPFNAFAYLLQYMYSGRLNVPAQDVGEVYRSAKLLRMEQAARACAAFLADRLTPSNCLGIRNSAEDPRFRAHIDDYIQQHVDDVFSSKWFYGLPELKVEIIGADEALENGGSESQLFNTILDWARNSVDQNKPKVEVLTEELNILYLNAENHLKDCKDVEDVRVSDDDVVLDYKKHSRRRGTQPNKQNGSNNGLEPQGASANSGPLPVHIFNINPEGGLTEKEWAVIATRKEKEHWFMGLAVLAGKMMAVSLHLRKVTPLKLDEVDASQGGPVNLTSKDVGERCPTLQPLNTMCTSRCAFGVCVWQESLVVCGGYDRGECLVSVEAYNPSNSTWTKLPNMLSPRARFGAASLGGKMYTIGGSDGLRDLDTVHRFDFETQKWSHVASLNTARSSVCAAELNGFLYCIGGSDGQLGLKSCEGYDPATNKWFSIAPMNFARSQASVSAYRGTLVVVGGTDSWNCLSSVEMYNPVANTWTCIASLGTIRRGAGIEVMGDKLWVVGGSDGARSLKSTETYDSETKTWIPGPPLNVPRANVSIVGVGGNLYAIGGFSGKKFLNTMEVLAPGAEEWCCYQPSTRHRKHRIGSGDGSSSGDEQVTAPTSDTAASASQIDSEQEASGSDQEVNSADEGKLR